MTEEQTPSKVLHVRSLPPETSEAELGQLCMPFGRVVGILMLSNKAQAFVQMEDVSQAIALVQYYNSVHAVIRGNVVFFQFSNRSELTTGGHGPSGSSAVCLRTLFCSRFVILFILGKAKPRSSRFRFQFTLSNHN